MKKKMFTYAVIVHTEKKGTENGVKEYESEIVIEPSHMLAKTQEEVAFKVTRKIDEKYTENPENVEILIRPF